MPLPLPVIQPKVSKHWREPHIIFIGQKVFKNTFDNFASGLLHLHDPVVWCTSSMLKVRKSWHLCDGARVTEMPQQHEDAFSVYSQKCSVTVIAPCWWQSVPCVRPQKAKLCCPAVQLTYPLVVAGCRPWPWTTSGSFNWMQDSCSGENLCMHFHTTSVVLKVTCW